MDGASFAGDPTVTRFFYLKYATSYATTSSMVLILHDFTTNFSQEVDLVWRSPWSFPKIVYLANRYISLLIGFAYMFTLFFADYTATRCAILDQLHTWYAWISTVLVQLVLQLWLYAIYSRCRQRLYWISAIYLLLAGLVCATLMPYMSDVRFAVVKPICVDIAGAFPPSPLAEEIQSLSTSRMPRVLFGLCMAWAAFTAILLGLLSARVWFLFKSRPRTVDGIAFVLFRDATLYCVTLLSLTVLNVCMVVFTPYALYQVGFGYAVALPSILSSHILLNLRESEKRRAGRLDVHGLAFEQWETMFHIT